MSFALMALRHLDADMQVHILSVGVAEGSCTLNVALEDAAELNVVPQLLDQLVEDHTQSLRKAAAAFVDPHGTPWQSLSDRDLDDRATWCMSPAHHDALAAERCRRMELLAAESPSERVAALNALIDTHVDPGTDIFDGRATGYAVPAPRVPLPDPPVDRTDVPF